MIISLNILVQALLNEVNFIWNIYSHILCYLNMITKKMNLTLLPVFGSIDV